MSLSMSYRVNDKIKKIKEKRKKKFLKSFFSFFFFRLIKVNWQLISHTLCIAVQLVGRWHSWIKGWGMWWGVIAARPCARRMGIVGSRLVWRAWGKLLRLLASRCWGGGSTTNWRRLLLIMLMLLRRWGFLNETRVIRWT